MATVPQTSITLLKAIANDAASVRWAEFCRAYDAPMHAFLAARFPTVEADDALQETLIALLRVLPEYTYLPDTKGHFRNYLLGILKFKALDILRRREHDQRLADGLRAHGLDEEAPAATGEEERAWKESVCEAALEQLLANTRISESTRQIFRRVALCHESPEAVAAAFGTTRNNVDQIKNRMVAKLHELVVSLTSAREGGRD